MGDYYEDEEMNLDELDLQQGVHEYGQMYNQSEINVHNFGLAEIDTNNIYAMKKIRMIEGEEKFFLRQMIYAYTYLKYKEKFGLQPKDFYTIQKAIKKISFYTKKSPIGLLLSYYVYDKNNFINKNRFKQIMQSETGIIDVNKVVPLNYMYKVYANDIIRYVKLFHDIL